jgi:EpsI family protein
MAEIDRRELALGGVFALLAAGCWGLRPQRAFARLSDDALNRALPDAIGGYHMYPGGDFIVPPEDELSRKLYDKTVTRVYVPPVQTQAPVMALFAYGSTQNLTLELHRPEECYPMQGFTLSGTRAIPLRVGGHAVPATFVTASRAGRTEHVLFWSRIGTVFPPSRWSESWTVAKANMRGIMPDGMLVRLSMIHDDADAARSALTAFAGGLGTALSPVGRQIVLGEATRA